METVDEPLPTICTFLFFYFNNFSSCEDDPLLAPQSGDEDDGGSYGNLSLPASKEPVKLKNPETF